MLTVYSPQSRLAEREYIYRVVLGEFMGLAYNVVYEERTETELRLASDSSDDLFAGAKLHMPDILLQTPDSLWLTPSSLPRRPLDRFQPPGAEDAPLMPVIYGRPGGTGQYIESEQDGIYLGIDIFGSSLFMLARYEELVTRDRDRLDRFPAKQSLAYLESFLHRPIINEYVELLWQLMKQLWPELRRRLREPNIRISHDVDFPYYVYRRSRLRMVRDILMDLFRRRDVESSWKKAKMLYKARRNLAWDPYNTFSWLMDLSEQAGIRSAFYFITEETKPGIDGNYAIDDPVIQQLLREIHARGHEIGLHPSYNTYLNPARIRSQFKKLKKIAGANGITQQSWGGRQHYLRWRAPDTWQFWEDAGLQYDSTLTFADRAGFRCGVCYEYPVFNLRTGQALALRERPLLVMDQTILHPEYMGLTHEQAYETIRHFYIECMKYRGDFTLLWHNSQLLKSSERDVYRKCLEMLGQRTRGSLSRGNEPERRGLNLEQEGRGNSLENCLSNPLERRA